MSCVGTIAPARASLSIAVLLLAPGLGHSVHEPRRVLSLVPLGRQQGYGEEEALGLAAGLALAAALAAAEGDADAEALADGLGDGLAASLGVGDGTDTSDDPAVETFWRLRLSPIGTPPIPSAGTIRKLTPPPSRRKNSPFKLRPLPPPAQS